MNWIKVSVDVSGTAVTKMLNMDNYKSLEAHSSDATKSTLTHNDGTTVSLVADFESAIIFFSPLLFKEDLLGNAL